MAICLWNLIGKRVQLKCVNLSRYGHHMRGKPPHLARSLKQRLEELNYKDPSLHFRVDIGFPSPKPSRTEQLNERLEILKKMRKDRSLEKKARTKALTVPLDAVKQDWLRTVAPFHLRDVADHYGIFQDLYGDAYFVPRVMLKVAYDYDGEFVSPVHRGNVIKPSEASKPPEVIYDAEAGSLWTLVLTNPDGHLNEKDAECVHWLIGNIPENRVSEGEVVWDYLQPFPPRGTGFHRMVFVLYKQERKVDYNSIKVGKASSLKLSDRTFRTHDFYRERQDVLTPAGLAFFQSDWDPSLSDFFHKVLDMKEPIYEYDFPEPYQKKQDWFPLKRPFNLYMDRYRDPKQIAKELVLKRLKTRHPFQEPEPPPRYPNIFPIDLRLPSWQRLEIKKERLRAGKYKDM